MSELQQYDRLIQIEMWMSYYQGLHQRYVYFLNHQ